jgi:hypothetical protein
VGGVGVDSWVVLVLIVVGVGDGGGGIGVELHHCLTNTFV